MYRYFQPTCVREFVCDGQRCGAKCCRSDWSIEIDDATYARYSALNIGSDRNFTFNEHLKKHCIRADESGACPFLDGDELCGLQRRFGEEILSRTCRQYPRQILSFGDYFERSLSLVCPIAAELILRSERLEFEFIDVGEEEHGRAEIFESNVPGELRAEFLTIQREAISILQDRSMSIDDRLLELGRYLEQFDPCVYVDKKNLLAESGDAILAENYLVHEFFINAYPWRFDASIGSNFEIYLSNCEELRRRAPTLTVEAIREFVTMSNHDMDYIAEQLKRLQLL